jgi:two-component system, sensor histidine kinase and response regulator
MMDGNRDKMREFAHKFLGSTDADLKDIDAALQAGDMQRLKVLGHNIKSPAHMVGAFGFAELSRKMEIEPNTPAQAHEIVAGLHVLLREIKVQIKREFPDDTKK